MRMSVPQSAAAACAAQTLPDAAYVRPESARHGQAASKQASKSPPGVILVITAVDSSFAAPSCAAPGRAAQ
jgi:hypothetical protein